MNFDDGYTNPLVRVQVYRDQAIDNVVRWVKKDKSTQLGDRKRAEVPSYWRRVWKKEKHYFIDERTGIVYERNTRYNERAFLHPIGRDDVKDDGLKLLPGHKIDDCAPIICQCGNEKLLVYYPASYSIEAKCPECGAVGGLT